MKASILLCALCAIAASPAARAQNDDVLAQDIRDIKGPIEIPAKRSALPWVVLGAGVVALGGAGFATLRIVRRTRKQTAIDAARASFAAARAIIPEGLCRDVAYRASETVRQFIERRLGLPASRETTEEFLRRLGDRALAGSEEKRTAFAAFLEACDLAKFSGWQLDRDQMTALLESGANLVEAIEKEQAK
jgi:hypothetical protein